MEQQTLTQPREIDGNGTRHQTVRRAWCARAGWWAVAMVSVFPAPSSGDRAIYELVIDNT